MVQSKVGAEEVLVLLEQIVDEFGRDYVYPRAEADWTCVYQEDGKPSCLVGHVLSRLGHDVSFLEELDERGTAAGKLDPEETGVSPEGLVILGGVQSRQDGGSAWGVCLDVAKRIHEMRSGK